jgi:hypothetical protein
VRGEVVIIRGRQGWGNRKGGCEAYGPGGRWATQAEFPRRSADNIKYGDLLGDHLDEIGAHEGAPLIVIASTSAFDAEEWDELRDDIAAMLDARYPKVTTEP